MSEPDEVIDQVRALLKQWDDGQCSRAEFACLVHDIFLDSFLPTVEKGETYQRFGSCCCRSHPPDRTFKVEIIIQPHGFTAKRCA
jgi:hypothetical protein